jgi:hypothetical protein
MIELGYSEDQKGMIRTELSMLAKGENFLLKFI